MINMRRTRIKTILLLTAVISLLSSTPLFAQRDFERHEFSFHAGYGNLLNETPALTLLTHDYKRKLAQGVSWDAQYLFRPLKRFIFGAIYTGFSSKGSHPEGSDHLWINFAGPQIGMSNAYTRRWQIRGSISPGLLFFRNNSEVFEKSRRVKGWNIGLLLNGNATYKLTPNLGIGIGMQYMVSGLFRTRVHYHGETTVVKLYDGQPSDLSRLNVTGGLSYYF